MAAGIAWTQESVAGVPLNRHVGRVEAIEVAAVEYDGSNRMWIWSSPLAENAWGWAPQEEGAKQAVEVWLRGWLSNFRAFLG
jgi:hypothetical protein